MAKCEDCICFKSCQAWCVAIDKALKTDAATEELQKNNAELCPSFKNTADVVEVKHGKWIDTDSFDAHYQPIYQCSVCHKEVADEFISCHKYCLHCGAEMDKKE